MRNFAEKTYWYLLGVVALQYIMLAARNVGFLPVWTLIEYM
jgi:nitroreductase